LVPARYNDNSGRSFCSYMAPLRRKHRGWNDSVCCRVLLPRVGIANFAATLWRWCHDWPVCLDTFIRNGTEVVLFGPGQGIKKLGDRRVALENHSGEAWFKLLICISASLTRRCLRE